MKLSSIVRSTRLNALLLSSLLVPATLAAQSPAAQEMPRMAHQDGRSAFMVDGKPYLMLGAQVSNSSGWPEKLSALAHGRPHACQHPGGACLLGAA